MFVDIDLDGSPRYALGRLWPSLLVLVAAGFASCRFLKALGPGRVHPEAEAVRLVHDGLARAESGLPIA